MAKYDKKSEPVAKSPSAPKVAEKKASKPEIKTKVKKNKDSDGE